MSNGASTSATQPQSEIRSFQLEPEDLESGSGNDAPLRRSFLIVKYAHESAKAFLEAFNTMRKGRGATRGATTDEEQDLLRAMLVMAAAGLDSMLKQIIRDALEVLIQEDDDVREGLEKFVTRQIRGDADDKTAITGHRFLTRVLIAQSQQDQVIEEYTRHLTGISLQSVEEVRRTARALGVEPAIRDHVRGLKQIFDSRNRIIHEFDIDFPALRRNRKSRTQGVMIGFTNALLELAEIILTAVDQKLASTDAAA